MERRITEAAARPLNQFKVHERLYGEPAYCLPTHYFGCGDAHSQDHDLRHFITADMRADWEAHRDELTRIYNGEATEFELFGFHEVVWMLPDRDDPRPWAAQMFDRQRPRVRT